MFFTKIWFFPGLSPPIVDRFNQPYLLISFDEQGRLLLLHVLSNMSDGKVGETLILVKRAILIQVLGMIPQLPPIVTQYLIYTLDISRDSPIVNIFCIQHTNFDIPNIGRIIRTNFLRCTLSFLSHLIHGQNMSKTKFKNFPKITKKKKLC